MGMDMKKQKTNYKNAFFAVMSAFSGTIVGISMFGEVGIPIGMAIGGALGLYFNKN